eukprot:6481616-Amphidinium_carterae.1
MSVAGSACQPYSSFGLRKRTADPRHVPFIVWAEERLAHEDAFIGFENSPCFPEELLVETFGKYYELVMMKLSPLDLGWPVSRKRLYVFGFRKELFCWQGPQDARTINEHFAELLVRGVVASGDVFLQDSAENHRQALSELAVEQKVFLKPELECSHVLPKTLQDFLSPSARRHLSAYEAKYESLRSDMPTDGPGAAFISDLNQNPAERDMSKCVLTSLTTRPLRYSHTKRRVWTSRELWSAHGWPALQVAGVHQERMPFDIMSLDPPTRNRLLGNGMHIPVCLSFFMYCLSHCRERATATGGPRHWPFVDATTAAEESVESSGL